MSGRALAVALTLLACGCGCNPPPPREDAALSARLDAEAAGRFDERRLRAALDEMLAWHAKNAPRAAALRPGLSDAEIDRKTAGLPFRLPQELRALYRWRDGSADPDAPFFWYHDFLSLDRAVAAYRRKRWLPRWGRAWFPLLEFQGESYFLDCATDAPARPVRYSFIQETEHWAAYLNLTAMAETAAAGMRSGAIFAKGGRAEFDGRRLKPIHARLNPEATFPYYVP